MNGFKKLYKEMKNIKIILFGNKLQKAKNIQTTGRVYLEVLYGQNPKKMTRNFIFICLQKNNLI